MYLRNESYIKITYLVDGINDKKKHDQLQGASDANQRVLVNTHQLHTEEDSIVGL